MITPEEYLQKYVEDYSISLNVKTLYEYQISIRKLFNYCNKSIEQIGPSDIRNWICDLSEKGYKPKTIQNYYSGVKMFFLYCLEEGLIINNPMASVPYPKGEDKLPHYLEIAQLTELRKLVEGNKEQRAWIEVFYATGVRISELIDMKKEDVNWSERYIYVMGKYSRERIVPFTKECAEYLKDYLDERTDDLPFIFVHPNKNGPITYHTIYKFFQGYREKLGFHFSPHTLRHTFAAHLAQKGMPLEGIQALLGHEKPKNTKIYSRLYDHARKEMYDEWM